MSRHSKRESGANPEQARCCKALSKLTCHLLDETTAPLTSLRGGKETPERAKPEDLPRSLFLSVCNVDFAVRYASGEGHSYAFGSR